MQGTDADPGVAPRAVTQLFDSLRRRMPGDDGENDDLVDSDGSEDQKQEEPVNGAAQLDEPEHDEEGKTLVR